jgi:hypothetical protein
MAVPGCRTAHLCTTGCDPVRRSGASVNCKAIVRGAVSACRGGAREGSHPAPARPNWMLHARSSSQACESDPWASPPAPRLRDWLRRGLTPAPRSRLPADGRRAAETVYDLRTQWADASSRSAFRAALNPRSSASPLTMRTSCPSRVSTEGRRRYGSLTFLGSACLLPGEGTDGTSRRCRRSERDDAGAVVDAHQQPERRE